MSLSIELLKNILKELQVKNSEPVPAKEAARMLGMAVNTLYKLDIPRYKPNGKMIYYDRRDIAKYAFRNRIPLDAEREKITNSFIINQ